METITLTIDIDDEQSGERITEALSAKDGVHTADARPDDNTITISYTPEAVSPSWIRSKIEEMEFEIEE